MRKEGQVVPVKERLCTSTVYGFMSRKITGRLGEKGGTLNTIYDVLDPESPLQELVKKTKEKYPIRKTEDDTISRLNKLKQFSLSHPSLIAVTVYIGARAAIDRISGKPVQEKTRFPLIEKLVPCIITSGIIFGVEENSSISEQGTGGFMPTGLPEYPKNEEDIEKYVTDYTPIQ